MMNSSNSLYNYGPGAPIAGNDLTIPPLPPYLSMMGGGDMSMNPGMGQMGGLPQRAGLAQALLSMQPPGQPMGFPEFSPTPMPSPSRLIEQQSLPSESQRMAALQNAQAPTMPFAMPGPVAGGVPGSALPTLPASFSGQGLGNTAPQTFSPTPDANASPDMRGGLIQDFFKFLGGF